MNSTEIIIAITSQVFAALPIKDRRYSISYSYEPNVVGMWIIEVAYLINGSWNRYTKQISDYELSRVGKDIDVETYIEKAVKEITVKVLFQG